MNAWAEDTKATTAHAEHMCATFDYESDSETSRKRKETKDTFIPIVDAYIVLNL